MLPSGRWRRLAVTGRGWLLPWGRDAAAGERLRAPAPARPPRAAPFEARDFVSNPKALRTMHRGFQLTAAAATLALRDAGLPDAAALAASGVRPERAGTAVAAGEINPTTADLVATLADHRLETARQWGEFGQAALHGLHPFRRLALLTNMAAAHVSILFGLEGPSLTLTSGPAAGWQILREAGWLIAENRADLMVCEAADTPEFATTGEATGEAAAAVVLEALEVAERRGARVWSEIAAGWPPQNATDGWDRYFPHCAPLLATLCALGEPVASEARP